MIFFFLRFNRIRIDLPVSFFAFVVRIKIRQFRILFRRGGAPILFFHDSVHLLHDVLDYDSVKIPAVDTPKRLVSSIINYMCLCNYEKLLLTRSSGILFTTHVRQSLHTRFVCCFHPSYIRSCTSIYSFIKRHFYSATRHNIFYSSLHYIRSHVILFITST